MDYEEEICALQARCERLEKALCTALVWACHSYASPWGRDEVDKLLQMMTETTQ